MGIINPPRISLSRVSRLDVHQGNAQGGDGNSPGSATIGSGGWRYYRKILWLEEHQHGWAFGGAVRVFATGRHQA